MPHTDDATGPQVMRAITLACLASVPLWAIAAAVMCYALAPSDPPQQWSLYADHRYVATYDTLSDCLDAPLTESLFDVIYCENETE